MVNEDGLKLKNERSMRGRQKSAAERTLELYRLNPHYPDLEDEREMKHRSTQAL